MSREMPHRFPPGSTAESRSPTSATLDGVAVTLTSEQRLLKELIGVVQRQRTAILASDLGSVEDSIFATRRILLTLNQVRAKRRSLNRLLDEADDLSVWKLEEVLGERMTPEMRQLCSSLGRTAQMLSEEVETNRRMLATALRAPADAEC